MKSKILIVDDEPQIRETIADILNDYDYETIIASDGESAEKTILIEDLGVIILDVLLPKKGGLELLEYIHKEFPLLPVIVISGHGNIKMAVDAMRRGAFDFIEKPLSIERILSSVKNALKMKELQIENFNLKAKLDKPPDFIGESNAVKTILEQLPNIAVSDAAVLITGENGTGKEVISQLIFNYSKRKYFPFISVNCAAIPDTLIESELFGYEKGAFTGANKQKKGQFELAHQGTIFLDEIADLSLSAQAKVLRVLQEKDFIRVGGNEKIKVDVRVISATNKNLPEMIKNGTFRQDLYYRLNVIPIYLPPLRERKEDIKALVLHFIKEYSQKSNRKVKIQDSAISSLQNRNWAGNVRELKNFVERMMVMIPKEEITQNDILKLSVPEDVSIDSKYDNCSLKFAKQEFEKNLIIGRLIKNNMNISKTAQSLDIERTYLHKKIKELNIVEKIELTD